MHALVTKWWGLETATPGMKIRLQNSLIHFSNTVTNRILYGGPQICIYYVVFSFSQEAKECVVYYCVEFMRRNVSDAQWNKWLCLLKVIFQKKNLFGKCTVGVICRLNRCNICLPRCWKSLANFNTKKLKNNFRKNAVWHLAILCNLYQRLTSSMFW